MKRISIFFIVLATYNSCALHIPMQIYCKRIPLQTFPKQSPILSATVSSTKNFNPQTTIIAWDFHEVLVKKDFVKGIQHSLSFVKNHKQPWQLLRNFPSRLIVVHALSNFCSSTEELIEKLCILYPDLVASKSDLYSLINSYRANSTLFDLVATLHQKGYKQFLLSNIGLQCLCIMIHRHKNLFSHIEGIYIPHRYNAKGFKLSKPERTFYQNFRMSLRSRYITHEQPIIFIDDNRINITAAQDKDLNMHPIHFTSARALKKTLKELGILD